ncbi:MAG: spore coat protein [Candidatus Andersenbacteria bacterium RIFCSPHIGHO2_12_FULL_46_9]|nr:MAG: spore coat protein [Candidatus Andersenbacteria bacterium RIFCSPHIGHO2_02_FULL_46_16]OGY36286.1 MAG: spore coat protein [Candidatus Andersenbacteria bacterium RIFCSPLOWO2_02_FULL_46_11]OGY37087.1 MAG: spore coat protein [Candidatus Andersenbacteria bacterium RIFCSPHIGHO2_12_FULL_46_9]OGY42357.1 MAG: spore coat protein [Candidatus Andersenbacteria bacterium RIFCSPLOWO2_12_FULL_45_8]HBE89926.1 spore coat protein [Candidatus Andersenbacteria bacterium]
MGEIEGVVVEGIKTMPDDRGFFREIFRTKESVLESVSQLSTTMSYPGVIKAFHYHEKQDDLWYCMKGMIQAVLFDQRAAATTKGITQVITMGEHKPVTLFIPHGVVHGYKVLGNEPAWLVYATTRVYDPQDEFRLAHDDANISFDWTVKPR